jgi:hypothetical protein
MAKLGTNIHARVFKYVCMCINIYTQYGKMQKKKKKDNVLPQEICIKTSRIINHRNKMKFSLNFQKEND